MNKNKKIELLYYRIQMLEKENEILKANSSDELVDKIDKLDEFINRYEELIIAMNERVDKMKKFEKVYKKEVLFAKLRSRIELYKIERNNRKYLT